MAMTWREACEHVLREAGEPLKAKEVSRRIREGRVRPWTGKTPGHTVTSELWVLSQNPASPIVRVGKGTYMVELEENRSTATTGVSATVVHAFGVHWSRDLVRWTSKTRLWGRAERNADWIDLGRQHGIYLLYDRHGKLRYVGRAKNIGYRLYEHTSDRLAFRWQYFSWFGIRPVPDNGKLGAPADGISTDRLTKVLEAILIEALEPGLNKVSGSWGAREYVQRRDPKL